MDPRLYRQEKHPRCATYVVRSKISFANKAENTLFRSICNEFLFFTFIFFASSRPSPWVTLSDRDIWIHIEKSYTIVDAQRYMVPFKKMKVTFKNCKHDHARKDFSTAKKSPRNQTTCVSTICLCLKNCTSYLADLLLVTHPVYDKCVCLKSGHIFRIKGRLLPTWNIFLCVHYFILCCLSKEIVYTFTHVLCTRRHLPRGMPAD